MLRFSSLRSVVAQATTRLIALCCLFVISVNVSAEADSDPLAPVREMFAEMERVALAQPYTGVTRDGEPVDGLFPVRVTGVSTLSVQKAAGAWLDSLDATTRARAVFAVDDSEWRRWSNVDLGLYPRQGVSLKEMTAAQQSSAWTLLRESLSSSGLALARDIMKTDRTLAEINDDFERYDESLYFFTVMGTPSPTEPWGWQIDGHHLVINYFVLGDQIVMTPTFLGAEPTRATTGKYAGNELFQDEQAAGLSFMRSLDAHQREAATLNPRKTGNNIQAEANKDNLILDFEGLNADALGLDQQAALLALAERFTSHLREPHAAGWLDSLRASLPDTWFSWVGTPTEDAVFYFRIHSPVILIEFDHQMPVGRRGLDGRRVPTRDHIHVIIRTPNGNDYGRDLLSQHLADHPH